ncbi:MAG: hypothetical protein A2148_04130, partial [Chloroflexi bacterium RBG_16_68_14]
APLAALLGTCTGSAPAPTPTPTETPVDLGPAEPEAERILEHVRVLSQEIGPRPAGSAEEEEVIAYAREQLEGWGYQVEVQTFTATRPDFQRPTTLTVEQPERRELTAVSFQGGGAGAVSGRLVDAGTGREEEFPPDARGAVVLLQRRDVTFADMARRAEAAGAIAAVVANKEPGLFSGDLDPPSTLPFLAIDQADGEALRELLARPGGLEVALRVDAQTEVIAHNVVARPQSGRCRTLSGGHYDSVPWAAGANDNASGSGLVLELARTVAAAGLSDHCFALFGAEEVGLQGSAFFVSELSDVERDELEVAFNYDVVGGDAQPLAMGGSDLLERTETLAGQLGLEVDISAPKDDISSDHRSFLDAGIPALMLTTPEFDLIHTAGDTLANLRATFLDAVATLGFALLEQPAPGP